MSLMERPADEIRELIAKFLKEHALGRENAKSRHVLQDWLRSIHSCWIADRTLRRIYREMPFVGYAIDGKNRGLFWITSKAEAMECERLRKSQGKACLAHGAETAKAFGAIGQMDLFGGDHV